MLIHQLAGGRNARLERTGDSPSSRQIVRESLASPAEQRLYLVGWQCVGKDANQVRQQGKVRFGEELFDLRCQLVDMGRSRRPRSFPDLPHNAIALHCGDLNAHGASRQVELGCEIVGCESAAAEQRHNSSAACIKQLLSQHFGYRSRVAISTEVELRGTVGDRYM
jgi:hypothetical protein